MSKARSPWLDEDARSLVRRNATIERAPAAAKARVFARVETMVATSAPGDAAAPQDSTRPSPLLSGGTRTLAIAAAFVLGGGIGALVMDRASHRAAPVEATRAPAGEREARADTENLHAPSRVTAASIEAPAASPPLVPPSQGTLATAPATPVARERPALTNPPASPRGSAADPAASPRASSTAAIGRVADERTLLDEARVAVEREDGAAALATTEEHARRYPRGILVQEREAIAVRALVLLGRTDEAHARVDRFRQRFPDSLLLPALESNAGIQPTP